jgi:hypothetical protein
MPANKDGNNREEKNLNSETEIQLKWQNKIDDSMDAILDEAIDLALNAESESVKARMIKELINKGFQKSCAAPVGLSDIQYSAEDLKEMKDSELKKLWDKIFEECIQGKKNRNNRKY